MKRRVIQLAGRTSVISLPLPWIKKYGINKGDELEILERGREIVIRTDKSLEIQKTTVDVTNMDEQALKWTLSALHKFGYDEIELLYSAPNDLVVLQQMVKDILLGFVIMHQTSKKVVLKAISSDLESEFDMTLRRSFLVTISLGEAIIEKLKSNDTNLKELIALEQTNNQLTNFCERILNKKGHMDFRKTCFYYVIIWNLEKICDDYRDLCTLLHNNKVNSDLIVLIQKTNELFVTYYNLFYKFSFKDLVELDKLIVELQENIQTAKLTNELYCLKSINQRIRDFLASTIGINHDR